MGGHSFLTPDKKSALKIALIYFAFSGAWILFSDQFLYFIITDSHLLTRIQTVKGWIFVLITALLIFFLLQRELKQLISVRQRLNESEEKYRIVVDSSPDLLYRTDLDGRIVFVSPSVLNLSGYSVSEAVGMKMAEEIYENPIERQGFLDQLKANGYVKNFEALLTKKDGTRWWASTNAHFYRDHQGDIAGIEGITRDVTRKKEAERALQESEHQLRAILEANPDPMVLYDLDGYPLYVNPAFTQVFGWTFEEVKGRKIPFVPEDEAVLSKEKIRKIFETARPLSFETKRMTKNKRILDIILSAAVIKDDSDAIYGLVVNITDISEKKNLEAQYEQAQKMESLGTLAGGIAHDFNNYLSGIFGYIDLARKYTTDEKVDGFLSKALKSSDRARSLTHQLLTFSKGGTPVKEVAGLDPFLKDTARFALSGANVSCKFDLPEDLWSCEYDKNQISQVIDNLVINSHHAMPDGGTVLVAAENLHRETSMPDISLAPGKYIKITISDTGTGIAPKYLKRVFDPFFSTKQAGSGLGLATSYSIIKRHCGIITVESELEKGSSFHVFLPATGEIGRITEEEESFIYKGEGRILIMDDEVMIRDMLAQMLEDMGFTVMAARDGGRALEIFKKQMDTGKALAAVILDLTIPGGMGGKETVKQIRKLSADIPVFVASGYSEDSAIASPRSFGFTASIEKPFLIDTLGKMLNKHLA